MYDFSQKYDCIIAFAVGIDDIFADYMFKTTREQQISCRLCSLVVKDTAGKCTQAQLFHKLQNVLSDIQKLPKFGGVTKLIETDISCIDTSDAEISGI